MTRCKLVKTISVALCLAMLTAGCGGKSATAEKPAAPVQTENTQTDNSQADDEVGSNEENLEEMKAAVDDQIDKSESNQAESATKLSTNTTIEETVLFEDENVRITAVSLEFKYNSPHLNLKFENNGDKALSFVAGSMGYSCNSINGYMVDGLYVNTDVEPGKAALEDAYIDGDLLTLYGIDKIAEIGIGFDISDDDYNDYAKTGPLYIRTSDAENYDTSSDTYLNSIQSSTIKSKYGYTANLVTQEDFLEQEEMKGLSACVITNKDGERSLFIEVENTSDEDLIISSDHISINGVVLVSTTWSSDSVNSGKKRVVSISLDNIAGHAGGKLEELGFTSVESIAMSLQCYDTNRNDIFSKEVVFKLSESDSTVNFGGEEVYNANDIRIVGGKIIKDDYDYAHIVLLAENNSAKEIVLDEEYGSLSINGIMADGIIYSLTLEPGEKGIMDVQLSKYDLQDISISDPAEINEAELRLEIRDTNYNEIDIAELRLSFT